MASKMSGSSSLDTWAVEGRTNDGVQPVDMLRSANDPHLEVESRERLALLFELSAARREVLVLHAIGYSHAEISTHAGLTPRQVERHMRRGRNELRELDRRRSDVVLESKDRSQGGPIRERQDLVVDETRRQALNLKR